MRIIKKFYCTGCKLIEMSATPENPPKCPKCGEIRVLMDIWILKGDWAGEVGSPSERQAIMRFERGLKHVR